MKLTVKKYCMQEKEHVLVRTLLIMLTPLPKPKLLLESRTYLCLPTASLHCIFLLSLTEALRSSASKRDNKPHTHKGTMTLVSAIAFTKD